jgi:hypothetical protein
MRIICSWCRGEGRIGLVGEKKPLEDRRETHGICLAHRIAVQTRWREASGGSEPAFQEQLLSAASVNAPSRANGDRSFVLSATRMWIGLKNLARKSRF